MAISALRTEAELLEKDLGVVGFEEPVPPVFFCSLNHFSSY